MREKILFIKIFKLTNEEEIAEFITIFASPNEFIVQAVTINGYKQHKKRQPDIMYLVREVHIRPMKYSWFKKKGICILSSVRCWLSICRKNRGYMNVVLKIPRECNQYKPGCRNPIGLKTTLFNIMHNNKPTVGNKLNRKPKLKEISETYQSIIMYELI